MTRWSLFLQTLSLLHHFLGLYWRWTLRLLAGKVVELGFAPSISPETVRQVLKKNELKPWQREEWCIPTVSAEFVAAMEDVLDLYW